MYLVLIAWFYVALMMAVAEATSPVGSILGAVFTFLLYGVLPMGVVGYIMASPARKRAHQAEEAQAANLRAAPNTRGETAGDAVASIRKEL